MNIQIGQCDAEHVVIDVQDCSESADEYGWLTCEISVKAGEVGNLPVRICVLQTFRLFGISRAIPRQSDGNCCV